MQHHRLQRKFEQAYANLGRETLKVRRQKYWARRVTAIATKKPSKQVAAEMKAEETRSGFDPAY